MPRTKKSPDAKPKEKRILPKIKCKGCGITFTPKDKRHHFHSPICRKRYYDRTYFKQEKVELVCAGCGVHFESTMPKKQKYHSAECRELHQQRILDNIKSDFDKMKELVLFIRKSRIELIGTTCTTCGRSPGNGISIDTYIDAGGADRILCNECAIGHRTLVDTIVAEPSLLKHYEGYLDADQQKIARKYYK